MSMRILNNRAIQYYQKTSSATGVKKAESASVSSSAKTDSIVISQEAAAHSEISGLTQSIAAEVETSVSSAKLQELSAKIAAGQYRIPTDKLVNSLFGGID